MKNILLFLCLWAASSQIFAQTPLKDAVEKEKSGIATPSVNTEEEALKKVVIAETDAYVKRDSKTFLDCYIQNSAFTFMGTPNGNPGSLMSGTDIQKFSKGMAGMMEKNKESEMQVESRTGWVSRIKGDMAWISYDQKNIMVKTGAKIKSKELKVLEKVDGQWKITSSSTVWDFEHTEYVKPNLDEEAIKKVILDEGIAFSQGNINAFMATYNPAPTIIWTVTNGMEPGDVLTFRGYDALKAFAESLPWFKNFKPESNQKVPKDSAIRDNWSFQFKGNIAIVNFDEHWVNDQEKSKVDVTCIKIIEKVNGQWKIINTAALADFKDATPPIRSKY